jgi:hypothetical protein
MWLLRFRYIAPYDYMTPLMYLPIQETRIEANTADEAWKKWINGDLKNQDNYRKESVEEI